MISFHSFLTKVFQADLEGDLDGSTTRQKQKELTQQQKVEQATREQTLEQLRSSSSQLIHELRQHGITRPSQINVIFLCVYCILQAMKELKISKTWLDETNHIELRLKGGSIPQVRKNLDD